MTLSDAIQIVKEQRARDKARCVIVNESHEGESVMMGTGDGYLNLAIALLTLVDEVDRGQHIDADERCAVHDNIKGALYNAPILQCTWIVSTYVFESHASFIDKLDWFIDQQHDWRFCDHPDFHEP